jgi:hypothetical protein
MLGRCLVPDFRYTPDGLVGCCKSFDKFGDFQPDPSMGGLHRRIEGLEFDPGHLGTKLRVEFGLELDAGAFLGGQA